MKSIACVALVAFTACATTTYRTGPSAPLPADPPQSPCERRQWLSLAPSAVSTAHSEITGGNSMYTEWTTYSEVAPGWGVYRDGYRLDTLAAQRVVDVDAYGYQQDRIDAIGSRTKLTGVLYWGGIGVALAGSVMLFASSTAEDGGAGLGVAGATMAVGGLTALVASFFTKPNALDANYYAVRRQVFLSNEVNMDRLGVAVDAKNVQTREHCQRR